MKNFISVLLAILLVVGLIPLSVFADDATNTTNAQFTFSVDPADKTEFVKGDTFKVTLNLANNTGFGAMTLKLKWNENAVKFNGFDTTFFQPMNSYLLDSDILAWYAPQINHEQGTIVCTSTTNITTNGKLFTANFEVIGEGDFDIGLKGGTDFEYIDQSRVTISNEIKADAIEELKAVAAPAVTYGITVNASENGTVVADPTTAAEGDKVTLTVTPDEGYILENLTYTYTPAGEGAVEVTSKNIKDAKSFTMPAANVTVNAIFTEIEEGYTVSIGAAEGPITAGQNVEIPVTVGHTDESVGAYNAYQLKLSYEEGLNFVTAVGSGVTNDSFEAEHDSENRTIQIVGYGADKTMAQNPVKLTFSGSTVGTHDVTLESAYVDAAGKANVQDAPEATVLQAVTSVQVNGFTVTLGTGLTADSLVAENGKNYTFRANDYSNYDYVITAKIGETVIPVKDNQGGTYTIEGKDITGNISITAEMLAKSYDVYVDDFKQSENATYDKEYSVTPKKDGYTAKAATVTIGGNPYTSHTFTDGTVTIPGKDIKGEIRITITWEQNAPVEDKVTVDKDDTFINGNKQTDKNQDYLFSLVDTENYDYDLSTLKVTIGVGENAKEYGKDDLYYDEATGQFTIPGNLVTGPITITVRRTEKNPVKLQVSEYLSVQAAEGETQKGTSIWLVTVSDVPAGNVAKYDGKNMFWSAQTETTKVDEATGEETKTTTGYGAFAYLVISDQGQTAVEAEAKQKVSVAALAENETFVKLDYSGNVNMTNKVDVNDAQLTYNMYNAAYNSFDEENGGVSMEKFLRADLISDRTVDTKDAAAVVAAVLAQK